MSTRMTPAGAAMSTLIAGAGAASAGDWAGRIFDRVDAGGADRSTETEGRAGTRVRSGRMNGNAASGRLKASPTRRKAKRFESMDVNGDGAALGAEPEVRVGKQLRE